MPIAPTFGDGTDLTIAVNLSGPPGEKIDPSAENQQPADISSPLRSKVRDFFRDLQSSEDNGRADSLGAYDIANQSFDTMQGAIARQKLAAYDMYFSHMFTQELRHLQETHSHDRVEN